MSDLYKVYINRKNGLIAIGTPENGTLRDITDAKPVLTHMLLNYYYKN